LSYTAAGGVLTLTLNNVESLPAKNYNVKLYITFNDSAIKTSAVDKAANQATAQNIYTIGTVTIGSNGTASSDL
jgi:hypothetical protein